MPGRARLKQTVDDVFTQSANLDQRAAVLTALANYLATNYVPRDAIKEPRKLSWDRGFVSTDVIEEIISEFKDSAVELRKEADVIRSREVPREEAS